MCVYTSLCFIERLNGIREVLNYFVFICFYLLHVCTVLCILSTVKQLKFERGIKSEN